jgi:hypothetical protein
MTDESTIIAPYIDRDIAVSDLTSPGWTRAHAVHINHYWSGKPAPESRHAEARLLWSPKALHIRYICNQAEPMIVSDEPRTDAKTMGLWDRDVCEIYIAPDPNAVEHYFELEAAPTGEWLDVAIKWKPTGRESDWDFASNMTTAAKIEGERVTIAMRIPWSEPIPQPQKGDRWRINLFRCVGKDPDRGYVAWRPTMTPQPSFHVPQAFGWLVFA